MAEQEYDAAFLLELEKKLNNRLEIENSIGNQEKSLTNLLRTVSIDNSITTEKDRITHLVHLFTKPRLNLSRPNIIMNRMLAKLLKTADGVEKYVRLALDPKLSFKNKGNSRYQQNREYIHSKLINNHSPFIPILTNGLLTISGHPDPVMEAYVSKEGVLKEQIAYGDGTDRILGAMQMDVLFKNIKGESIWLLFDTWLKYIALVRIGRILPYPKYILARIIDYQTGIWSIALDDDRTTIKHLSHLIAFPEALNKGRLYDKGEDPKRTEDTNLNVRFRVLGVEYDDPILLFEFNKEVAKFIPGLRGYLKGDITGSGYVNIPPSVQHRFQYESIPFIDLKNGKLLRLVHESNVKYIVGDYEEVLGVQV